MNRTDRERREKIVCVDSNSRVPIKPKWVWSKPEGAGQVVVIPSSAAVDWPRWWLCSCLNYGTVRNPQWIMTIDATIPLPSAMKRLVILDHRENHILSSPHSATCLTCSGVIGIVIDWSCHGEVRDIGWMLLMSDPYWSVIHSVDQIWTDICVLHGGDLEDRLRKKRFLPLGGGANTFKAKKSWEPWALFSSISHLQWRSCVHPSFCERDILLTMHRQVKKSLSLWKQNSRFKKGKLTDNVLEENWGLSVTKQILRGKFLSKSWRTKSWCKDFQEPEPLSLCAAPRLGAAAGGRAAPAR